MNIVLKYMGDGDWIALIPNRDLTDYDLAMIADRDNTTEQELIDMLCSRGLYQLANEYLCHDCGKVFKSEKALIKHELTHIEKEAKLTGEENENGHSINST